MAVPLFHFKEIILPFLVKPITDYFKLASELGYLDIMVNTNGSLINEKVSEKILESN